ncbi:adenosylcobinamide-phosphate synthase [Roseovarius nanhaiticus]|uniref:Cobalamin biosynthesis protein CobD n=1 Tax=Roseovarius nanhaiticus TaxID=573024 RepID=A0A1N7FVL3_9RHOB|nr:adenosylcobinamide-phosphate synthase CbiB [Roseovarius nanhaiticus]SEK44381.1 adenosylcobinamide-phosphate synthase [Roseovarius nanhaiticus]SIS04275.1 adenosylcobinamide-phosphate synthase [Roseovarius nanhaiticus]
MTIAAIMALAMALDAAFGEPRWIWSRVPHPAVLMGRAIDALEAALNRGTWRRAKGVLALAVLCAGAWGAGAMIAWAGDVASVIAAAILLAQRSLVDHVAEVARALRRSLEDGRRAVAMIVGRDTGAMSEADVSRAAIESASENFSDGVIAPLFWLAIAGVPGLVLYKAVNTADSMIGHRTPRHAAFGWASARLDDLLNLAPARLSAALIALLTRPRPAWAGIVLDAHRHRSPNGGWPEAAMARSLNVALSGPRAYGGAMQDYPFVHPEGMRAPGPAQVDAAVRMLWRAWSVVFICACVAALLL